MSMFSRSEERTTTSGERGTVRAYEGSTQRGRTEASSAPARRRTAGAGLRRKRPSRNAHVRCCKPHKGRCGFLNIAQCCPFLGRSLLKM